MSTYMAAWGLSVVTFMLWEVIKISTNIQRIAKALDEVRSEVKTIGYRVSDINQRDHKAEIRAEQAARDARINANLDALCERIESRTPTP